MKPTAWQDPLTRMTANDLTTWLQNAARLLTQISETPNLEAQLLLARVLNQARPWIMAHADQLLTEIEERQANTLLQRRLQGEPLPYILQHQEFYGLDFHVTPAVLIPRPETELLVDKALSWITSNRGRNFAVDVGTGSGCIAVSLAVHAPDLVCLAVDASFPALQTTRGNAAAHHVLDRVWTLQSDLLSGVSTRFDLICANLPYIPSQIVSNLEVARHEPLSALDGEMDGLSLIRRLLEDAPRITEPGGLILLEVEAGHGETAPTLAARLMPTARISLHPDLAGHPRLLEIQLPE